jgi:N-carbamoylputrescine amidase
MEKSIKMKTKIAIIQIEVKKDLKENINRITELLLTCGRQGANIILLPELFSSWYFPQEEREEHFQLAYEKEKIPFLQDFLKISRDYNFVLPLSYFEKDKQNFYNSLLVLENGSILGQYRKSHIPDGPCYEEKFFFSQGQSGFKVFKTQFGNIGMGICWDQWFPECARIMTLMGADILLYPTAIGSEPEEAHNLETQKMWKSAMLGHAVCNSVYIAAANRVGKDKKITFYGNSFISDYKGDLIEEFQKEEGIKMVSVDLKKAQSFRAGMGFFRDRRPSLYHELTKE